MDHGDDTDFFEPKNRYRLHCPYSRRLYIQTFFIILLKKIYMYDDFFFSSSIIKRYYFSIQLFFSVFLYIYVL